MAGVPVVPGVFPVGLRVLVVAGGRVLLSRGVCLPPGWDRWLLPLAAPGGAVFGSCGGAAGCRAVTPVPSREPSRRAPVDAVISGVTGLVHAMSVDPATLRTSKAAADFLVRRGFPVPSDTAVLYAVVETDASRRVVCVVGVFRSAREAEVYADATGWPDFEVAPFRLHPSWLPPGQP